MAVSSTVVNRPAVCIADFDVVGDAPSEGSGKLTLQSPMSDGTIEEDFEAALARESAGTRSGPASPAKTKAAVSVEDFSDIASYGIVEVVGDDVAGRKIIVVSACKLPASRNFDHQRFMR
jgi:Rho GTPase-activating protein 1